MKNLKKYALAATIAVVAGFGIYLNQPKEQMSDVMLANIEVIANGESNDGYCHTNKDYSSICNYYDNGVICPCGF